MHHPSDGISGVASWLQVTLAVPNVSAQADPHRDVIVFRVPRVDEIAVGELEISEEAFADNAPDLIISDLIRQRVPERLKADPTMRLAYHSDRDVPHLETRIVVCDGRRYRFVRDSGHAVRVFDSNDQLLINLPSPLAVKPASLYRRDEHKLCDDVRGWRGPNQ